MTMYLLQGMMRQESMKANANKTFMMIGTISDFDGSPNNFLAVVELYPADPSTGGLPLTTGWLPILTPGIGIYIAPNLGDIVEVHFQEGSLQNGYVALRSYSLNSPPTQDVKAGEILFVHSSGSTFKMTNDGKVTVSSTIEIDIAAPIVNITQSSTINLGDGTLSALLNGSARGVYNNHTHSDPQGGTTGIPNQQMTTGVLTQNTSAS